MTLREFIEYYTNISSTIDNDEYFELMITNAWNLNNVSYGKAWAGEMWLVSDDRQSKLCLTLDIVDKNSFFHAISIYMWHSSTLQISSDKLTNYIYIGLEQTLEFL